MKEIAKNEYYELAYDGSSNWVYWTMKGFWRGMSVVPNFESDWQRAMNETRKPFRIFADLSTLKAMPEDVKAANDKMQQRLMQSGCCKVSCLMDNVITKMALNQVIKDSGMEKMVQYFASNERELASNWLKA